MAPDWHLSFVKALDPQIREAFEASFDADPDSEFPATMIAAIRFVDQLCGIGQHDDRIVLHRDFAYTLPRFGSVVAPTRLAAFWAGLRADPSMKIEEGSRAIHASLHNWFEFTFDKAVESVDDLVALHPAVSGQTITMRLIGSEETGKIQILCASVRAADGSIVRPTGENRAPGVRFP